jgi:hypothetical protein
MMPAIIFFLQVIFITSRYYFAIDISLIRRSRHYCHYRHITLMLTAFQVISFAAAFAYFAFTPRFRHIFIRHIFEAFAIFVEMIG